VQGDFTQPGNFTSPSGNQPIAQTNSFSSHSPQDSPTNEARNWFVAIDQDGNEELSYEELRSALLTNGSKIVFFLATRAKTHSSPVSTRQAVLERHGEISREHL
jgi:hypothetical protein